MHFRNISAKIQLKNLKQHFDLVGPGPPGYALVLLQLFNKSKSKTKKYQMK